MILAMLRTGVRLPSSPLYIINEQRPFEVFVLILKERIQTMFKLKDTTTHHIPKPSFSDVLSTSTFANILAIIGIIIVILCIFSITFILIFRLSMSNLFAIISAISLSLLLGLSSAIYLYHNFLTDNYYYTHNKLNISSHSYITATYETDAKIIEKSEIHHDTQIIKITNGDITKKIKSKPTNIKPGTNVKLQCILYAENKSELPKSIDFSKEPPKLKELYSNYQYKIKQK